MPRLSGVRLSVSDPAQLARFYTSHLGMAAQETDTGWRVGYPGEDADIVLCPGGRGYTHTKTDRYWKVGLTLPNIDIAHDQLSRAGIAISTPHQFHDIGYMCHLSDPEGFQIELLQHDFEANRPAEAGDPSQPLGGGARIGQITLRTGDIAASRGCYEGLGMRHLSHQPVTGHGFNLWFLAFADDRPPVPDLAAGENREWLWRRPYTTLEFQHRAGMRPTRNPGYAGLTIAGLPERVTDDFGDMISPPPS